LEGRSRRCRQYASIDINLEYSDLSNDLAAYEQETPAVTAESAPPGAENGLPAIGVSAPLVRSIVNA
jgi:hypothetical protein